jgi:putative NIF3 family GTP cyclohydrolase 1 type 2
MTTVQQLIDAVNATIPGAPFPDTLDTIKAGDPSQEISGVVTTFLATRAVLERAVDLGANLVITHEPTFYGHFDDTEWLSGDPVYEAKRGYLDDHELVVWRFHDGWHAHRPDGMMSGVLADLGWGADEHGIVDLGGMRFGDVVDHVSRALGAARPRWIGDPELSVRTLGIAVGAPGGQFQMRLLQRVDALLAGEVNEWETTEYVRDAITAGIPKALVVAGHEPTEEAGMRHLATWLADLVPGLAITHVPSGDPFAG